MSEKLMSNVLGIIITGHNFSCLFKEGTVSLECSCVPLQYLGDFSINQKLLLH